MPQIYTVTLNPAIDMMLYLGKFEPAVTNRISRTLAWLGGKGTHVSLDLRIMGLDNVALGIAHGETGRKVIRFLEESGVRTAFQQYEGAETRTNYLIVEDSGRTTTLSNRGEMLSEEIISSFISHLRGLLKKNDWLVLSGDASNCPDPFIYKRIMEQLSDLELKVFMDASGETLKRCAAARPYLIKPNRDELAYLTGLPAGSEEEIQAAVRKIEPYGIPITAVSLGEDGSLVKNGPDLYRVRAPRIDAVNTNGCGDCFLAAMVYGIRKELPFEETLRVATAASAATAESQLSAGYDTARAKELERDVQIEKL